MRIDPHVHCRDGKQRYKTTIEEVFRIADRQGVEKIFDMPNTDPPILTTKDVEERLKLVPKSRVNDYFLYIGATANPEQLEEAVRCYNEHPRVIGIKLFAGESVGDLKVIEEDKQRNIYKKLSELAFKGVLAVHCEKEKYMEKDFWDPSHPLTHSWARPKRTEIYSIEDQINFAEEVNFPGILHIVHVSVPESVELIEKARGKKRIDITCGVTPQHIMWSNEMLNMPYGLLYKMNPPLRNKEAVEGLIQKLREGKIDWIETDHAPHASEEKLNYPHLSGYPSLELYKFFVEGFLPRIGVNEELIKRMTYDNIVKTFENKLK